MKNNLQDEATNNFSSNFADKENPDLSTPQLDTGIRTPLVTTQRFNSKPAKKAILKEIAYLSGPIFLSTLIASGSGFIGMAFLSQYNNQLSGAGSLINSSQTFLMLPVVSLFYVCTTKMAEHLAANRFEEVGFTVRSSMIVSTAISIPVIIGMLIIQYPLTWLQQPISTVNSTQNYMYFYAIGVLPNICNFVFFQLFMVTKDIKSLIGMNTVALLIETSLGYPLINSLGIRGLSLARAIQSWCTLSGMFLLVKYSKALQRFKILDLGQYTRHDYFKHSFDIFRKGFTITAYTATQLFTELLQTMIIGWHGDSELAIFQPVVQYLYILVPPTLALAQTANVLVARQKGWGDYFSARFTGNSTCLLATGIVIITGLLLNSIPLQLASLFIDTGGKEDTIRVVFAMISIAQVFEAIRQSNTANLRGLEDIMMPAAINLITTLAIILPISFFLNWLTGSGLIAVAGAQIFGLIIGAGIMTARWFSKINSAINTHHGISSSVIEHGEVDVNTNRLEQAEVNVRSQDSSGYSSKFFLQPRAEITGVKSEQAKESESRDDIKAVI